jgi:predicted MFS family arabinose efflux permease
MELTTSPLQAAALPRLSRRAGFWAIALSFLAVTSFSTAPSALYGIYERQLHLSSLTITLVYAVYAVGVTVSLLLAGHISDWYGRRAILLPSLSLAIVAALIFITSRSLPALLVARVLTGITLGASVATATAYLADLDAGADGMPTRRSTIVATMVNVGGIAVGPLLAGVLARYAPDPLTLPFVVTLIGLVAAAFAVALAPEGHEPLHPRPRYRPQRLRTPAHDRGRFMAAVVGIFLAFAAGGLFAGLAGTILASTLHHPSPALAGLANLLAFGSAVAVQIVTLRWPVRRQLVTGITAMIIGLAVLVTSTWTASLALFLIGGVLVGAGNGAIFRAGLGGVIATSSANDRAGALATFFVSGYAGVSVPVLGVGIALEYVSPQVALLAFAIAVGAGLLAAAPGLIREEVR